MSLGKLRVAIPTKGHDGIEDVVSEVFGRAPTFTIFDVEEGKIKNVKVLENPAISYQHGTGPIVVKMLTDEGVNVVLSNELGPGASALLAQHNTTMIAVKPGIKVSETLRKTSWSTINIHI